MVNSLVGKLHVGLNKPDCTIRDVLCFGGQVNPFVPAMSLAVVILNMSHIRHFRRLMKTDTRVVKQLKREEEDRQNTNRMLNVRQTR